MLMSGFRGTSAAVIAESDGYLSTVAVGDVPIMQYWKNASKYLALQKMAMDYVSITASTVQAEKENSKARYVITDARTRLSSKTVQATMCLKFLILNFHTQKWNFALTAINS